MHKRYSLVVFDWDGTLMDSAAQIVASVHAACVATGLPCRSDEAVRGIIGLGLTEAVQALYPDLDGPGRLALVDAYRAHYLAEANQTSRLFDGAEDVLRRLRAEGLRLAVATGKSRRGLVRVLEQTGLGELFAASRCADEAASKPHPQMLREIMAELGTRPGQTLMVGDTVYDLEMARQAGVAAVAAGYGTQPVERLAALEPLALIGDIRELPDHL